MWKVSRNNPSYKISGNIISGIFRDGEYNTFSLKKGLEIWDTPMVNISVWVRQAPYLWKNLKMRFHFFMNISLEINFKFAVNPDYNIGTDSNMIWNVTIWVCDSTIGSIMSAACSALQPQATRQNNSRVARLAL